MRKNILTTSILAIFIVLICLGSVSATEESQFNSTVDTVNDVQLEKVVLDETHISTADDSNSMEDIGDVSVESYVKFGNDLILKSDDYIIGDDDFEIINIGIAAPLDMPTSFEPAKNFDDAIADDLPESGDSPIDYVNIISLKDIDDSNFNDDGINPVYVEYLNNDVMALVNHNDKKDPRKDVVRVYTDLDYGVENSTVTLTPLIFDRNGNAVTGGTLKIFSDYQQTDLIAIVEPGNGSSFDFEVPQCPDGLRSLNIPIWYSYEKLDDENNTIYYSIGSLPFHTMKTNNLNISGKGNKNYKVINGTVNIREGDSLIVLLDNIGFWDTEFSDIKIYIEGIDESVGSFDHWNKACEIKDLPAGEYEIYAVYDGYVCDSHFNGGRYFAPGVSNMIKVKVAPADSIIMPKTAPLQPIEPVLDNEILAAMPLIPIPEYEFSDESVTVIFDVTYGMEKSTVKMTPTVLDENGNAITKGYLNLYKDYKHTQYLGGVSLYDAESFDFEVPECSDNVSSMRLPIYYTFEMCDYNKGIRYADEDSFLFRTINTNTFTISVRDDKGREANNGTIVIGQGKSLFVTFDKLDYKLGSSHINIKIEGVDNNMCYMYGCNFDYASHEISSDMAKLPVGEYVIYAVCEENIADGHYIAPATSNRITVKIIQEQDFFDYMMAIVEAIENIEVPA